MRRKRKPVGLRIRKELVRFCAMLKSMGCDCVRLAGFTRAHAAHRGDARGIVCVSEGKLMSKESLRHLDGKPFGIVLFGTFFRTIPSATHFSRYAHSGEILTYKIKKIFVSAPGACTAAGFGASSAGRRSADCLFETGSECPGRTINLARDDLAALAA